MATSHFHLWSTELTLPPNCVKIPLFLKLVLGPILSPWGMVGLSLGPFGSSSADGMFLFILGWAQSALSPYPSKWTCPPPFFKILLRCDLPWDSSLTICFPSGIPITWPLCSGVPHPFDHQFQGSSFMVRNSGRPESEAQCCHLPALRPQASYFFTPSLSVPAYKIGKQVPLLLRLNDPILGPAPETL